jgi:hypothetical protein
VAFAGDEKVNATTSMNTTTNINIPQNMTNVTNETMNMTNATNPFAKEKKVIIRFDHMGLGISLPRAK